MRHPGRHVGRRKVWRLWSLALVICALLTPLAPAKAEKLGAPPTIWPEVLTLDEAARFLRLDVRELETLALRKAIPARRINSLWRFNRDALLAWLNGEWSLITTAVPSNDGDLSSETRATPTVPDNTAPLVANVMSQTVETETKRRRIDASTESSELGFEESIGEAPRRPTADEVFIRGQRVLLAPGQTILDVGLFYTENNSRQLALVSGGVGLATNEAKTFTTHLLGRYGLFDETEIFASMNFHYQQNDVIFGTQELSSSSRSELGGLRLGLRRTLFHEGLGTPDVIATIDTHIPVGDTSYALGGGLALVKSFDPAVLFANINYRHTFSRDFADVSRLEPKERVDATLSYAFALNDTLTLSTAFSGLFIGETTFDNATLRQQELFSLRFGLTSWLAEGLYIEPTVSFGLNGPGDRFAFGVTIPYTF